MQCCHVSLVRGFRFKIIRIQRAWRTFKTMQTAQVVVVSVWLTNLRSSTIKDRKQLEKDLKDHKDNKSKAKAGGRKQVDDVRIKLDEALNALPQYEVADCLLPMCCLYTLSGPCLLLLLLLLLLP